MRRSAHSFGQPPASGAPWPSQGRPPPPGDEDGSIGRRPSCSAAPSSGQTLLVRRTDVHLARAGAAFGAIGGRTTGGPTDRQTAGGRRSGGPLRTAARPRRSAGARAAAARRGRATAATGSCGQTGYSLS
jgi:hypothetical protein